ncbi:MULTISPECIES: hypothetical protein [Aequorivita]|uniref:CHAD domain-containing protein n=1 Tax=Aequorivita iocasae TaxID=2803865 RepID=A0ABX7DQ30_9FLAO|nr:MULTISPECIES: hypothetical protein [Aequorivita]QQX76183.1 hypothetical protein JK629_12705 [Aequorivita iocasae]UCA55642.1 hypothetical protein LDL78_12765 [Aequorivita sp. F7]
MTPKTHLKFIEWRNTAGLHEDTLQSISELNFLKDELKFLKKIVTEYALNIIVEKTIVDGAKINTDLGRYTYRAQQLLKDLKVHANQLKVLLDDIDVPDELQVYKAKHYKLMLDTLDLHVDVKKTKRKIFSLLGAIIKNNKRRKISNL